MTFEEFAHAEMGSLSRFAAALCGDRGLAEDVLQESLLRAHTRWSSIETSDSPAAYVRRMIVNEFLSWRRKPDEFEFTSADQPGDRADANTSAPLTSTPPDASTGTTAGPSTTENSGPAVSGPSGGPETTPTAALLARGLRYGLTVGTVSGWTTSYGNIRPDGQQDATVTRTATGETALVEFHAPGQPEDADRLAAGEPTEVNGRPAAWVARSTETPAVVT